ncbi:hypothetical protein VDP36_16820 [Xanthomonas campestris pv. campestris]|nr:hypothetical protein [Xanthomonas campestris pv. campestris]MEB2042761.1 hypothetical protein [Xanthomonas campestris pv. campestris]
MNTTAHDARTHYFAGPQQFTCAEPRAYIAQRLRNARRKLRDHPDEIDLAAMGVAA